MSSRWTLAVPALALGACFSIGPVCNFPPPPRICDGAVVCVASARSTVQSAAFDFERPCTIASCGGRVLHGDARLVPSIHPSLVALEIGASSTLELEAVVPTAADGATVSANVRCDPGGALFFEGDEASRRNDPVNAETGWTTREWVLRTPSRLFASWADARGGPTARHLRFSNRGAAPCAIDVVRFDISAIVCTEFCTPTSVPIPPWDSGVVRPMDASSPPRDAGSDVLDAGALTDGPDASESDADASFDGESDAETDALERDVVDDDRALDAESTE